MGHLEERYAASITYRPGAGFVFILALVAATVVVLGFVFWYVPAVGLKNIHPLLPYIAGGVFLGVCVFILAGISTIAGALFSGSAPPPAFRGFMIRFLLPLSLVLSGFLRGSRIKIEQVFLDLNNRMVRKMMKRSGRIRPEKLLILTPHCIQRDDCKVKVTRDVENCVRCGRCEIGELVELALASGIKLFVLTGGTVARRKLHDFMPEGVVAVACERDLVSGIVDAYPLPVVGVVNKRPHGYCMETGVDTEEIKQAMLAFLFREKEK
jgi:hypothetical protein